MKPPLKPFKISIEGKYCEVPHKDRLIMLYNDSEKNIAPELELTPVDVMVICHEICCFIKRRLQSVMTKEEVQKQGRNFDRYFFGTPTGKEKLKEIKILIKGDYCEEFCDERNMTYTIDALSESQANIILYDLICTMRNNLATTMTRDELTALAEKYKIENFGMLKNEIPFESRTDGKQA